MTPGDRISPSVLAYGPPNSTIGIPTMSNARPSARQLQAFYGALQQAAASSANIASLSELAARRDAYLASLR